MDKNLVNEWINYDSDTGVFTWKKKRGRVNSGDECGSITGKGYQRIRLNHKNYMAHRMAWLIVYGQLPSEQIDHMNRVKSDNRIINLRELTNMENVQNKLIAHITNKTGMLGVYVQGGRYRAAIEHDGKRVNLGMFDTAAEASDAYLAKKRELHVSCVW
jgi:hypothetical protein